MRSVPVWKWCVALAVALFVIAALSPAVPRVLELPAGFLIMALLLVAAMTS